MRLEFGSAAARMARKAKALFRDDDQDNLNRRLDKLVARRRAEPARPGHTWLSSSSADNRASPLYDQSVYGSVSIDPNEAALP